MLRSVGHAAVLLAVAAAAVVGCSSSDGTGNAPTSSSTARSSAPTTPTGSNSTPTSPAVQAAIAAYEAFNRAVDEGLRNPSGSYAANVAAHSVDPARETANSNIASFRLSHIGFRGTPPAPRINVTGAELGASPWPTFNLIDCPTVSTNWKAVNTKTGKTVPLTYPSGSAKPPHAIEATVIKYKAHWVVQTTKTNVKHTCVP